MLEERDAELAVLARVLAAAIEGTGAGVLIEGPPGIGKTRLMGSARGLAGTGVQVLSARASELEHDFPFAIVRQLLELVARDQLFTGAAALAAPVLTLQGGEEDAAAALHGLYWLTANLAAEHPLLILVDDLHWTDPPSLRWLAYLAQRLDGLAVGLIAASRPDRSQPLLDVLAANPSIEVLEHEESVAVLHDSPARLEFALSLLEHGAALRRGGQRANAREPLRKAIDIAAECGATAVAARAHDELVAAGARPRRDPIESRSRLTASEQRVARMAAEGMTNREIAQALFLTEKTIEVHLTSTYRKLDISSRSQLSRALESGGNA